MDRLDPHRMTFVATAVVIDLAANAIRLSVPDFPETDEGEHPATLDVGANGRLIGLEIDDRYISVMDLPHEEDPYARSAGVSVRVVPGSPPWITLPRRGTSYEITYPSGNECWQVKGVGGKLIQVCATIDAAPGALHGALEPRKKGAVPPGTDPGSRGQR
jgi:hypothetical protein